MASPDIIIIGSGMGGATVAAGLAASGARIVILERGEQLQATPEARDTRAIFQRGHYRPKETWLDQTGTEFSPGNYYYVGGNSKFYGAVLLRYRERDFAPLAHADGDTTGWPFAYAELEPWYTKAEQMLGARGKSGEDSTEPPRSAPYPFAPVPDEPSVARARLRLNGLGLHVFSIPLGVDIEAWLRHGKQPWDAYPDTRSGKIDAETGPLTAALKHANVTMETSAKVTRIRLAPDGKRIAGVDYQQHGEQKSLDAATVILSAGAVNSAALLLANGLANASDMVGRHFMNHNSSAMLAIDPRETNPSVYQKTISFNDFYFTDGAGGPPLGNAQLLGKITAPILKANMQWAPEALLAPIAKRSFDWYLMSEDLAHRDSRVMVKDGRIVLHWQRTNMTAHNGLIRKVREVMQAAGYPIVLNRTFDRRTPSHQCGTVRMGNDAATAPLDPWCRSYDHPNLFVVDASFLPTSAAVNPALTVAAQSLRVADHIARSGGKL